MILEESNYEDAPYLVYAFHLKHEKHKQKANDPALFRSTTMIGYRLMLKNKIYFAFYVNGQEAKDLLERSFLRTEAKQKYKNVIEERQRSLQLTKSILNLSPLIYPLIAEAFTVTGSASRIFVINPADTRIAPRMRPRKCTLYPDSNRIYENLFQIVGP